MGLREEREEREKRERGTVSRSGSTKNKVVAGKERKRVGTKRNGNNCSVEWSRIVAAEVVFPLLALGIEAVCQVRPVAVLTVEGVVHEVIQLLEAHVTAIKLLGERFVVLRRRGVITC